MEKYFGVLYSVLVCIGLTRSEVTVTFSTQYPNSGGYSVVDGELITLECLYPAKLGSLAWTVINHGDIYFGNSETGQVVPNTAYTSRIINATHSSGAHSLTIIVDRDQDQGVTFRCSFLGEDDFFPQNDDLMMPDISYVGIMEDFNFMLSPGTSSPIPVGTAVVLTCSLDANPSPNYSIWTNNGLIQKWVDLDTDTVTLSVEKEYNKVKLFCRADGPLKGYPVDSLEQWYTVEFQASNIILIQSTPDLVSESTTVTLTCVTDEAEPTADVVWTVGGKSVSSTAESTENGRYNTHTRRSVLELRVNRTHHKKEVVCFVSGKYEVRNTATLDVVFAATSITLISSHWGQVSENTEVVLTCTTGESNPTAVVVWTTDGVTVTPDPSDVTTESGLYNTQRRVSRLRVRADRTLNGAVYRCTVNGTQIIQQYIMDVTFPATTIGLVLSHTGLITENTKLTFTCVTDESNPTSNIVWTRDGSMLSTGISVSEVSGLYNSNKTRSVLTVTTHRSLNGAQYKCYVGEDETIASSTMLQVKYPPSVSVEGLSSSVQESSEFLVYCSIEYGNPKGLTIQHWEFEPKYPGSQSQALPEQTENRELRIESTVYTDAGTYRCTAGNTVGSDTGDIQVVVHYPPQLDSKDSLIFYAGLNDKVALHLKVRAFPEYQYVGSAFIWTQPSSQNGSTFVILSSKLSDEVFESVLTIYSVRPENYGVFVISTTNGVEGVVNFTIELKQNGQPEAPRAVEVNARAAEQVVISWVVGLNGGSTQTFKIMLVQTKTNTIITISTDFVDPPEGTYLTTSVISLIPETEYRLYIVCMNLFNGSSETSSDEVVFVTRAKPRIAQERLQFDTDGYTAKLTWEYTVVESDHTVVVIEQCKVSGRCTEHTVTDNTNYTLVVLLSHGNIFYLVIYLDGLQSYRSQQFTRVLPKSTEAFGTDGSTSSNAGAIVGGIIAVLFVIVAVTVGIWFYRRKTQSKATADTELYVSEAPFYQNVQRQDDSNYEILGKRGTTEKTFYEDLTAGGSGKPSEEKGRVLYENIKKSEQGKIYDDDSLDLGQILCKGSYTINRQGILKTDSGNITVMVKMLKASASATETKYLSNQQTCLEKIGSHRYVVETFPVKLNDNNKVKLVTKYYPHGNLKKYINGLLSSTAFDESRLKGHLIKLCLDVLQGLTYLETLQPEILHYCLSSQHVLVDDTGSCRLTGFDYKHHVLQREMEEEEEGVYGAIEWKAPETIEDCKAHTKHSDVWAFGVLLYEIFMKGGAVYEGMTEDDIKLFVKSGQTLPKPNECPNDIYNIMKKCWEYDPTKRPDFHSIMSEIKPMVPVSGGVGPTDEIMQYEPMTFSEAIHN